MQNTSRRNSASGGVVSLRDTLDAGRKAMIIGRDDPSLSMCSGYTQDPTDFTERSVSSSLCLSETGQVMVNTRVHQSSGHQHRRNNRSPNLSTPLPPPPFFEEDEDEVTASTAAEVQEIPRKPKSRRCSMFGSSTPSSSSNLIKPSSNVSPVMIKPRRRSFFGSSGNLNEYDLPEKPQSALYLRKVVDRQVGDQDAQVKSVEHAISPEQNPKSLLRIGKFRASSQSFDTKETDEKIKSPSTYKAREESTNILVKAFLFASPKQKKKEVFKSDAKSISRSEAAEVEAIEQAKKPRSRRRHSLFGNNSYGSADTRIAPTSRPPTTPKKHPRRRRRSFFSSSGEWDHEDGAKPGTYASAPASPTRSVKPSSISRSLGKGSETITAALTPRSNNPYELVNNERVRRKLPPFVRSMLLDSVAKDVATQLSISDGAKCRPTDYHGNIGKGVDIWTIHEKMMAQKGIEKANIIASHFFQIGVGMARGKDGQVFLCQLFQ